MGLLDGKVAVITGASKGIGAGLAIGLRISHLPEYVFTSRAQSA